MRIRSVLISVLGLCFGLQFGCYEPQEEGRLWVGTEHVDTAIVGGHTTTGWDSVVMVYAGGGICTGTVVAPDVVLTAAHCLEGVYGSLDVFWCDECIQGGYLYFESQRQSSDYHQHNQYNPSTMVGDIAVVVLNQNAPTPPHGINRDAASNSWLNSPLTFVGFGVTQYYSDDSGVKREVDISISEYDGTFLYYYSSNQQTCFGDSGGPAFTDHTGTWRVAGVTSYGDEHCNSYGADVRVDHYASWVDGYTGGWEPDDDDDDAADDDDQVGDDDDQVGDDDDHVGDDDDHVGDDDTTPDPSTLPEPRTNSEYDGASGFSCIGSQAPTSAAPWSAVVLLLAGVGLLLRRR